MCFSKSLRQYYFSNSSSTLDGGWMDSRKGKAVILGIIGPETTGFKNIAVNFGSTS